MTERFPGFKKYLNDTIRTLLRDDMSFSQLSPAERIAKAAPIAFDSWLLEESKQNGSRRVSETVKAMEEVDRVRQRILVSPIYNKAQTRLGMNTA